MTTLTILPSDSFVASAFAELLADVTNLLAGARAQQPQDKDEIKFWQAQFNALNKAQAYWLQGVRPSIAPDAYLLASASRPGALIHRLAKQGGIVVCSCEASQHGRLCFHHMLVNVLERAAELEMLEEDGPIIHLALPCDPPNEPSPLGDNEGDSLPSARPLGPRIAEARRNYAYAA